MNKFIIEIIGFIIIILLIIGFYVGDKNRCEKNGGIYIWEWSSYGTKCHFK